MLKRKLILLVLLGTCIGNMSFGFFGCCGRKSKKTYDEITYDEIIKNSPTGNLIALKIEFSKITKEITQKIYKGEEKNLKTLFKRKNELTSHLKAANCDEFLDSMERLIDETIKSATYKVIKKETIKHKSYELIEHKTDKATNEKNFWLKLAIIYVGKKIIYFAIDKTENYLIEKIKDYFKRQLSFNKC